MAEESNVKINKMIVHILDNEINLPVLSQYEHPSDSEIIEFIENHVSKLLNDDNIKHASFLEGSSIKDLSERLAMSSGDFIEISSQIALNLYTLMQQNPDIPSCDLVCALVDIDGSPELAILKMNYRSSYIHYINGGEGSKLNSIIKQKTTLPNESQKIDECAIINLSDLSIKVIDKKYEINGEKISYFSEMFIKCSCTMSDKEKVQLFKKATKSFAKKYLDEDISKAAEIKRAVAESIDQNDAIYVETVAESAFRRNPDMRNMYIEHIEKAGLDTKSINIKPELSEKVFKRHKIKTDTGIEINLPVDCYKDQDVLEFITNADGTISILIKNINKITDV